ncbi:MAG: hypothetical protein MRQ07_05490 [Candidatus Midichloria sp.]|nr:hypothetical protein [Candidatus Midichloria sp.]
MVIKSRGAGAQPVNSPSYEVVVPAALSMTDMGEYLNSLNGGSIKATSWDESSYDV